MTTNPTSQEGDPGARAAFEKMFLDTPNQQCFVKAGFLGFQGGGKTFTSTIVLGVGLYELGRVRGQAWANKPMLFIDTENGSDWVKPILAERGIQLRVVKSRSFATLLDAVPMAEDFGGMLQVDSVTHFWRDMVQAKKAAMRRTWLEIQEWDELKTEWSRFTTAYINGNCHMSICGRAGYEYDEYTDETTGKRKIEKVGVKMRAEGETGYEPSLLVQMDRVKIRNEDGVEELAQQATVLKDRSDRIDGRVMVRPTFDFFLPHIEFLNLGGRHVGVASESRTREMFEQQNESNWSRELRLKKITLEEIEEELLRQWPGSDHASKQAKAAMIEKLFRTRSWAAVSVRPLKELKAALRILWKELRGEEYVEDRRGAAHDKAVVDAVHEHKNPELPPDL